MNLLKQKKNIYNRFLLIASIITFVIITTVGAVFSASNGFSQVDTTFSGYDFAQMTYSDSQTSFNKIIMQSQEQKESGATGIGVQSPSVITTSSDGKLMLYGTKAGGLYKSTDNGENFTSANKGLLSTNILFATIDPKNSQHAVVLAKDIYYSLDGATSWNKGELPNEFQCYGQAYLYNGIEFDKASFNGTICTDVYLSTPFLRDTELRYGPDVYKEKKNKMSRENAGLYVSKDGGKSFELFINDIRLSDGMIKITDDGKLFVANEWGLFEVDKNSKTITEYSLFTNQVLKDIDGDIVETNYNKNQDISVIIDSANYNYTVYNVNMGVTGFDYSNDKLYVQTWDGIYTIDKDKVVNKITNDNTYTVNKWPQFLCVSKTNENHLIYQYRDYTLSNPFCNHIKVSFDGGKTWQDSSVNQKSFFNQNTDWNRSERRFIIDTTDDSNVLCFADKTLTRSEDGGVNFKQVSGISNLTIGGRFNYNYYDSNLMFYPAKSNIAIITTDGGVTYKNINLTYDESLYDENDYYKYMYGGFASDENTYFGFVANQPNGDYYLAVTHDGGKVWSYYDGIDKTKFVANNPIGCQYFSCLQSYNDPNILYAENFISFDNGYSWSVMNKCESVIAINPSGNHELYGTNSKGELLVSYDEGRSWQSVIDGEWGTTKQDYVLQAEHICDIALDFMNDVAYVVVLSSYKYNEQIVYDSCVIKVDLHTKSFKKLNISIDDIGVSDDKKPLIKAVAVDPNCTSIIYVGCYAEDYICQTSLLRSSDGGESFVNLTSTNSQEFTSNSVNEGGYNVHSIKVLPTGKLVLDCGELGLEYIDPPYSLKTQNITLSHIVSFVVDNQVVNYQIVGNRRTLTSYIPKTDKKFIGWYYDSQFSKKFNFTDKITKSFKLYAKFE